MSDLQLHQQGWDLEFIGGDLVENAGAVETAQAAKWNCLTIINDMFDDVNNGIPYFSDMFNPTVTKRIKAFYLERACLEAPSVSLANITLFDNGGKVNIDIFSQNQELRIKL